MQQFKVHVAIGRFWRIEDGSQQKKKAGLNELMLRPAVQYMYEDVQSPDIEKGGPILKF